MCLRAVRAVPTAGAQGVEQVLACVLVVDLRAQRGLQRRQQLVFKVVQRRREFGVLIGQSLQLGIAANRGEWPPASVRRGPELESP